MSLFENLIHGDREIKLAEYSGYTKYGENSLNLQRKGNQVEQVVI